MKCYNCKTEIPEGAKFCGVCGEAQGFPQEVIDRAAAGDEFAVAELYNKTYASVYLTVKGMVRDEDAALDIVQDAYVKAFRSLEQLSKPDSFRPWIKTIARNRAVDYLRKEQPVLFSSLENEEGDMPEFADERPDHLPEVVIDEQETTRLLKEMLDSLPADQRACISMFYYEDMPIKEIAAALGVSENTVKSRLNYGKQKIKANVEALEKKGVKLYGLGGAPIALLLLLLRKQGAPAVPARVSALTGSGQTIRTTGRVARKLTSRTLAKGAAGTAGKLVAVKAVAVIAAVAVGAVSVVAGVKIHQNRQLEAVAEETMPEVEEEVAAGPITPEEEEVTAKSDTPEEEEVAAESITPEEEGEKIVIPMPVPAEPTERPIPEGYIPRQDLTIAEIAEIVPLGRYKSADGTVTMEVPDLRHREEGRELNVHFENREWSKTGGAAGFYCYIGQGRIEGNTLYTYVYAGGDPSSEYMHPIGRAFIRNEDGSITYRNDQFPEFNYGPLCPEEDIVNGMAFYLEEAWDPEEVLSEDAPTEET